MSVDPAARAALARALRLLATGRVTNREYEDLLTREVVRSADPGVQAVMDEAWFFYCDLRTHRLRGRDAPGREGHRSLARMLVFLGSALPYEWPREPLWIKLLLLPLRILTLGLINLPLRSRFARAGDIEAWPFLRRADAEAAAEAWPSKTAP